MLKKLPLKSLFGLLLAIILAMPLSAAEKTVAFVPASSNVSTCDENVSFGSTNDGIRGKTYKGSDIQVVVGNANTSSESKVYSDTQVRWYANENMTVSGLTEDIKITKIVINTTNTTDVGGTLTVKARSTDSANLDLKNSTIWNSTAKTLTIEPQTPQNSIWFKNSAKCFFASLVITYETAGPQLDPAGLTIKNDGEDINGKTLQYDEGTTANISILSNPNNIAESEIKYTSSNELVAYMQGANLVVTGVKGTAEIHIDFAGNEKYSKQSLSLTVKVVGDEIEETLIPDDFSGFTTTYKEYTAVGKTTGITYGIYAYKQNGIQINKGKGSGIKINANPNGYEVQSITLTYNKSGTANHGGNIYVKENEFTKYESSDEGKLAGTFTTTTSEPLSQTIDCSKYSGMQYFSVVPTSNCNIDSFKVTYVKGTPKAPAVGSWPEEAYEVTLSGGMAMMQIPALTIGKTETAPEIAYVITDATGKELEDALVFEDETDPSLLDIMFDGEAGNYTLTATVGLEALNEAWEDQVRTATIKVLPAPELKMTYTLNGVEIADPTAVVEAKLNDVITLSSNYDDPEDDQATKYFIDNVRLTDGKYTVAQEGEQTLAVKVAYSEGEYQTTLKLKVAEAPKELNLTFAIGGTEIADLNAVTANWGDVLTITPDIEGTEITVNDKDYTEAGYKLTVPGEQTLKIYGLVQVGENELECEKEIKVNVAYREALVLTYKLGNQLIEDITEVISANAGDKLTVTANHSDAAIEILDNEYDGQAVVTLTGSGNTEIGVYAIADGCQDEVETTLTFNIIAAKGSKENPYTVTEFKALSTSELTGTKYVRGFVVGYVSGTTSFISENITSNTNWALGATKEETSSGSFIPVQLPSDHTSLPDYTTGETWQTRYGLKEHSDYLGKEVLIGGIAATYFDHNGIKPIRYVEFIVEEATAPGSSVNHEAGHITWEANADHEYYFTVDGGETKHQPNEDGKIDINSHEAFQLGTLHKVTVHAKLGESIKTADHHVVTAPGYTARFVTMEELYGEDLYRSRAGEDNDFGQIILIEVQHADNVTVWFTTKTEDVEFSTLSTRAYDDEHPEYVNLEEYLGDTGTSGLPMVSGYTENPYTFVAEAAHPEDEKATIVSAPKTTGSYNDLITAVAPIFGDADTLRVYDLDGREVKGDLAPGIYIFRTATKTYKAVVR